MVIAMVLIQYIVKMASTPATRLRSGVKRTNTSINLDVVSATALIGL